MKAIDFYIYNSACALDITGPLEVFSIATELLIKNNKGYKVHICSDKIGQICTESGLKIYAEKVIEADTKVDYFIVPGGRGEAKICRNKALIKAIKSKASNSKKVVSICTGAFILAEAGLLENKTCTTHWLEAKRLSKTYSNLIVDRDSIFVKDGNVYTSAGITAGIDLALELVQKDYGAKIAKKVARLMVVYFRRSGGQSQFSAPLELKNKAGEEYEHLHDWIQENISEPLLIEDLAEHVAMSPRNFSRDFVKKTNISPGRYVELIRFNKARELLESSNQTLEFIAQLCGFIHEERLRRVFVRTIGVTPFQYRLHFHSQEKG